MSRSTSNSQTDKDGSSRLAGLLIGVACGAALAYAVHWITMLEEVWQFIAVGASIGAALGIGCKELSALWRRARSDEWRVTEIEIATLGQKVKLANSGSQRRVAWSLFVETTTRIATEPISDAQGDDNLVLKSLYDLFQASRKSIMEMEPTRVLPSRRKNLDTVETYVLTMLNQDLRPFLSKWHPIWDAWQRANPGAPSSDWPQHITFRNDLKILQPKIRARAIGLGEIAGVPRIEQLMNAPTGLTNNQRGR